jgi:hypothetical protein
MAAAAAVPRPLVRAELERARDVAFRRVLARRIRGERGALAFVEEVGICSTFYRFPEGLACLWEAVVGRRDPRWPRRSHHDAGVGLTWELKDRLPARRAVYYGKLLKGRPVLVAIDLFPPSTPWPGAARAPATTARSTRRGACPTRPSGSWTS